VGGSSIPYSLRKLRNINRLSPDLYINNFEIFIVINRLSPDFIDFKACKSQQKDYKNYENNLVNEVLKVLKSGFHTLKLQNPKDFYSSTNKKTPIFTVFIKKTLFIFI